MTAPDCVRCGQPAEAHPPQPGSRVDGTGVFVPLATNIRKARAKSVCGLCDDIIQIGNQIGRVPGYGWAHTSCIIAAQRKTSTEAAK